MSRTRKIRVPLLFLAVGLALAGCSKYDPYERAGIWKPSGVNDANIAAMVADPADLTRGREKAGGTVRTATTAVERLWQGGPQQRPQAGQSSQQGQGAGQPGAAAAQAPR